MRWRKGWAVLLTLLFGIGSGGARGADLVVLLHGLGRTTASMTRMAHALEADGYRVINLPFPSSRDPIVAIGERYLAPALAGAELGEGDRVHFVTHSLGGIVLREYLVRHEIPALGRVVMLSPPNQGSEVADRLRNNLLYQAFTGPAGQELGTDAASVPRRLGPVNYPLGVLVGDRTIDPWFSWFIPGPDDGKVSLENARVAGMADYLVVHATHTFIMMDPETIRQTRLFLQQGHFDHGQAADETTSPE